MKSPSNIPLRIRRISSGQMRILQTLWGTKLRRAGKHPRPERSREARLLEIAEIAGRAVRSSKDLTWKEANLVIQRWLQEGSLPGMPARPESPESLSEAQLWKIRQIEQYFGWGAPGRPGQPAQNEKRLEGFLKKKFQVDHPEQLSHDQAWRAIEALCAVGVRERIRARKGKTYSVKRAELTRAVAALKAELQEWRPAQP